jgi:transposase
MLPSNEEGRKMVAKAYHVRLTDAEHMQLRDMVRMGKHGARELTRARILLHADAGRTDDVIAEAVQVHRTTVERLRQRFATQRLGALKDPRRGGGQNKKLDGRQEAWLVATACSPPPEGRETWTLQLLADRMVELKLLDAISDETVRRTLKKMRSSPGKKSSGASRR